MNDLANPHFAEPRWLWLAVLGPLLLLALQRYSAWARRRQLAQVAAPEFIAVLTRSHSPVRRALKNVLLVLACAGIGLALARPQWGVQAETSHSLGQDTVFILDCSRSMLATDVAPNRLQRAKLAILEFVQRHSHGRVGLVAFAGQAFLQCPLTFDYSAFQDALAALDDKTIPVPGTDVGRALDEGLHALDKAQRQRLLVLVTDGEDLEKGGVREAEALAKQGVVVFTVGVGTPAGAEIQWMNEQGKVELVHDNKGQVVRSRLDEPTLRAIAQATHGAYYPLGPLGEGLAKVRLALENLDSTAGSAPARKLGVDRFHLPVAIVVGLLAVESLIGTRRRLHAGALALLFLALSIPDLRAANPSATVTPDMPPTGPQAAPPTTPREYFNAGTQKLHDGKLREAEAYLQSALASQNERLQPPALYNLGHVRFGEGVEELKKGPAAKPSAARARAAAQQADEAMHLADDALAGNDIQKLVAAYMRGRGARKELKAATTAVRRALEAHGNALGKWSRASGDFKSAVELNRADADAQHNAEAVDRYIAKLVDSLQELQMACNGSCDKDQPLGEKLKQLKGRIPAPDMPPGAAGDDEEDQDSPMGPEPGQKEGPSKDGQEMTLSPEEAGWLLEGYKLDSERRLPMGQKDTAQPKERSRPTW
jgi:Ca-activated chloride channel homolog